jgi:hypothetical protein
VQEKLKLENSEMMMAANLLFQKTNGHPRTTMVSDNHDQTVQEKLKLENSEIMMAANLLFQKTNGHPK